MNKKIESMSRTMKDSGIEWIGDVPEEWEVHPFKAYYKTTKGLNITKENLVERGIPVISYGQIHSKLNIGTSICDALIRYVPETYLESNPECLSKKYDIFFADTSEDVEGAGNIAFVDTDTPIFAGYHTIIARPQKEVKTKYFAYLAKTDAWRTQIRNSLSGVKVFSISQKLINRVYIILPPLAEQHLIATFLDKKCSEIDSLIDLQEQMIEELKAYKQSVITEAVTKGLNPNVQMKDSGVEWIGDVPEHWEVKPLKFNFNRRSERNNPILTTERLSLSIDNGVTLYSEKTTNLDRFKDDFTQYQLAYPNDIILNCMNMIVGAVGLSKYMGCVSPVYYVIYPSNLGISAEYYSYLLNTPTIRGVYYSYGKGIYAIDRGEGRVNTCRLKVSYDDFGRFDIPIPPIEEQKEIVSCIKQKCADIDRLIELKQSKIEHLKEYKKSVIYEYVTGKKEP